MSTPQVWLVEGLTWGLAEQSLPRFTLPLSTGAAKLANLRDTPLELCSLHMCSQRYTEGFRRHFQIWVVWPLIRWKARVFCPLAASI